MNMQNGGLGSSPYPPGHDHGIQKFSSERDFPRDSFPAGLEIEILDLSILDLIFKPI
jgi:hypothetical protein